MKRPKRLVGIYNGFVNTLATIGAVIIFLMMLAVSVGVATRFFLDRSPVWLIEICGYGMVFMTFLVAAWVLREDGHVKVDLLLDHLVPIHRSALECIMSFVGAIACLVVAGIGVLVTMDHLQRGVRTSTDLSIPWAPLLAVIPLGVLALSVQLLLKAVASLKKIK